MTKGEMKARVDDALLFAWNLRQRAAHLRLPLRLRQELAANATLASQFTGRRCFILGNGPSLARQDLTRLQREQVFVVNRFIHHPQAELINPKFYVLIDSKVSAGKWGTRFLHDLEERLPHVTLFVTYEIRRYLEEQGLLRNHRIHTIHPELMFHFGFVGSWKPTGLMPCATNVVKATLFLAIYLGFSPIYLMGVDGNGLIATGDTHFYGRVTESATMVQFESDLMSMAMGLRGWRAIARWCASRNIDVFYANPEGIIESFRRVDYSAIEIAS